jgi:hypothetical protein
MHSIMKTNIGNELHFNLPPDRLGCDGFWGILATIAALFLARVFDYTPISIRALYRNAH